MNIQCTWKNGMLFSATNGTHVAGMDGKKPFGAETELSPKELVIAGLCGCTAMDVVGFMKKNKQSVSSFAVDANVTASQSGHPFIFTSVALAFKMTGEIDANILLESIRLSQTKYCGVSAMLAKAVPISYTVELNGQKIGEGKAEFAE